LSPSHSTEDKTHVLEVKHVFNSNRHMLELHCPGELENFGSLLSFVCHTGFCNEVCGNRERFQLAINYHL